jgi:hypothetical protein
MKQANWRIRGAAMAMSSGLATVVLLACSGDDSASPTGPDAASSQDSSTIDASSQETSTNEAASGDSASVQDVVVADSPLDSAKSSDGGVEADASLPPIVPLQLCGVLDTDWGLTPPVTNDDRATPGGWDFDGALGSVPLTLAEALTSDCEMSGLEATLNADAGYGAAEYIDQVANFTLQFLGCGAPEAGALSFTGLMPTTALGPAFVWTRADLDRLTAMYSNAIVEAASYGWAATYFNNGSPPSTVPLTDDQVSAITAQLAALEAQAIAAPTFTYDSNATKFTFSTCGVDAGSDAADGD